MIDIGGDGTGAYAAGIHIERASANITCDRDIRAGLGVDRLVGRGNRRSGDLAGNFGIGIEREIRGGIGAGKLQAIVGRQRNIAGCGEIIDFEGGVSLVDEC